MERLGIDRLHLDLADDHFVPNLGLSFDLVRDLSRFSSIPLDVHLMLENVDRAVDRLLEAGVEWITFHLEATAHIERLFERIHATGAYAGLAIAPGTPVGRVVSHVGAADLITVLCVEPGFPGGTLVPGSIERIRFVRQMVDTERASTYIAADGNVSLENIPAMVKAGADMLILGSSSLFRPNIPYEQSFDSIRKAASTPA